MTFVAIVTDLRRLVARGLVEAVVTSKEGRHGAFVRYATTKAGRALLTGGAPEPKPRSLFRQYLETAGISRRVRWHDLRHSFASSLVAGLWGRPWRLEEVCKVMGHSSITVTERYAHLADDALKGAVLGTPCLDNLQVRERVHVCGRNMLRAVAGHTCRQDSRSLRAVGPQGHLVPVDGWGSGDGQAVAPKAVGSAMGAQEDAAMTVDVGADAIEITMSLRGDRVYSQSARVAVTAIDKSELVEAVLLALRRAPDLAEALGKAGIVLRSVAPLAGLDVLLREQTGLPVRIAR